MSAIIYGMANAEYRAHEGLSYSESKLLERSPAHLRWWLDHPEARTASSAPQAFGTMVHTALLEPATFDQRYAIGPAVNKNTAQWRDFRVLCETQGILPTTEEDRVAAFTCAKNVRDHPVVGPLLAQGHSEVSVFWTDPPTGCKCKARLDFVATRKRHPLLLDLKTAQDASRQAFKRSVVTFQYHRQAHWYEGGYAIAANCAVSPMLFVVVESLPPFAVAAYTLDRWFMAQAAKTNHALKSLWQHCIEFDDYPAYNPDITELDAPRYALDEELRAEQREEEYAS
ncbi:MAG TPA: PD-(D/E)XK nuclease-like domain-containing protein [Ktedonobacterales bacterium]|jgi:exodeoxyribonuclease VIII|nr:PD-(D/E)XK nuclease-like domain-containing protein [Ktedonobacterales bacterium]